MTFLESLVVALPWLSKGPNLLRLPCSFLDGLKQSLLKIKSKNLRATPCWPLLVPSGVPLLLLPQVLWVEGESPRLHWGLGRVLVILNPGWVGDWQALIPGPQAAHLPDRTWGTLADPSLLGRDHRC